MRGDPHPIRDMADQETNQGTADTRPLDLICDDCGEAFSSFLQEIADHNAKVTACPKCGENHPFHPAKIAEISPKKATRPRLRKKVV